MAANVETMFSVREKPWHGLGKIIADAPNSEEAIRLAGLDWNVYQQDLVTMNGLEVPGFKVNIRDGDDSVLGIVTDRYKVVQNHEAFRFTDELLGKGVRYETAGSLQDGKRTWILAKLPNEYIILEDQISPYLVFFNSHDGSGSIRCAVTPIRVECQNTLNLALATAKRSWSAVHTQSVNDKMQEAAQTLFFAEKYMAELGKEIYKLHKVSLTDSKVLEYIEEFFPDDVIKSDLEGKRLVYVTNQAVGEKLRDELIQNDVFATFLCRKNRDEEAETFNSVSTLERFEARVLITTAVVETGINFRDDVTNIMIESNYEEQFLQMLGRRGFNERQSIRLYIPYRS